MNLVGLEIPQFSIKNDRYCDFACLLFKVDNRTAAWRYPTSGGGMWPKDSKYHMH